MSEDKGSSFGFSVDRRRTERRISEKSGWGMGKGSSFGFTVERRRAERRISEKGRETIGKEVEDDIYMITLTGKEAMVVLNCVGAVGSLLKYFSNPKQKVDKIAATMLNTFIGKCSRYLMDSAVRKISIALNL